jgi:hypothetical protein
VQVCSSCGATASEGQPTCSRCGLPLDPAAAPQAVDLVKLPTAEADAAPLNAAPANAGPVPPVWPPPGPASISAVPPNAVQAARPLPPEPASPTTTPPRDPGPAPTRVPVAMWVNAIFLSPLFGLGLIALQFQAFRNVKRAKAHRAPTVRYLLPWLIGFWPILALAAIALANSVQTTNSTAARDATLVPTVAATSPAGQTTADPAPSSTTTISAPSSLSPASATSPTARGVRTSVPPLTAAAGHWAAVVRGDFADAQGGKAKAMALAASLRASGDHPRVFPSSTYSSLRPGFWVVAVGDFGADRAAAAAAAANYLHRGYTEAYARCLGTAAQCS